MCSLLDTKNQTKLFDISRFRFKAANERKIRCKEFQKDPCIVHYYNMLVTNSHIIDKSNKKYILVIFILQSTYVPKLCENINNKTYFKKLENNYFIK